MFNDLFYNHQPYGSISGNGQLPNWNAADISTPSFYSYPCGNPTPGYVAPMMDVTINTNSYKYNAIDDTMEFVKINNKGKVKIKKLSNGFNITNIIENLNDTGEILFAAVHYTTKTFSGVAVIPGDDYVNGKFEKHFDAVIRMPGCSKSELNSLVAFLLKTAPCQKQKLYPHQGMNEMDNGFINFAGNPGFINELEKYISPSVLKRKGLVSIASEEQIIAEWSRVFSQHPMLCYLTNQYISALLLYFLDGAGIHTRDFPCIKPSDNPNGVTTEKLTAMLSTNNFHKFSVPTLDSGKNVIEKEYCEVYDGVFLINDSSFADEEDKIIDGVKAVIRCVTSIKGRNIPMIISKNAGFTAAKLAPDNAIVINTEGIELNCTAEEIEYVTDAMTALVFQKVLTDPTLTKAYFTQKVPQFRQISSQYATGDRLDNLTGILVVEAFLTDFFGIRRFNENLFNHYSKIVNNKGGKIMNVNTSIKKEFAVKLSEKFRAKGLRAINKVRNLCFDDDGATAVISGNRLMISSRILETIVSEMNTIKNSDTLINAFKADGELINTDGLTHPFDSHNSIGEYQRLYYYDIPADILDADVLYTLQNPETAAFLLDKAESCIPTFMPLIRDRSGKIAGRLFCYNDAENDSIALYGQSGEGKSFTSAQIMASRYIQGYEIIAFDTSDSTTYEALCTNLSKKFVDENVVFHKLDNGDLNINIFNIDRDASLPSQKKELLGIITAGVGDLSVPQTNTLRSVISDLLEVTDKEKSISPDDLLALLDEEGATYESILNRLEPFIEDIKEYRLTSGNWKNFFGSEHKIHVVQINEGYSGSGNQIVDALLAGLFNYKRENPQKPLSIFIDEVQNQNFSVSSPIRKILKEGRKHHLSLISATQDFYARSTEIGSALGKSGTQIFHRPSQDSANLVAAELRWKKADIARFDTMNRGDVIIKGALYNKEHARNVQMTLCGHIIDFLAEERAATHNQFNG